MAVELPSTLPLVELDAADPVARGRQHGEQARAQLERSLDYYERAFARSLGLSWAAVTERAKRWLTEVERYAPDLLDEARGIAAGGGVELLDVLALNARGEIVYDAGGMQLAEEGCTSFALLPEATGDGHLYAGQNWDWRADVRDTVVGLRVQEPGKPTIVMQVEAGQVGRHGLNSAGIALNANGLGGRFDARVGVPQPFIRRRILQAASLRDAMDVAFAAPKQIPTNLLLADREGFAIDLEATPHRTAWMYPSDGILVHGNHYEAFIPAELERSYRPFAADSLYRVPRIRAALGGCREAPDSEAVRAVIRAALSDHFGFPAAVCAHADEQLDPLDRWETVTSTIVDLTTGEYLLAHGTPCTAPHAKLPWNVYAETGPDPSR